MFNGPQSIPRESKERSETSADMEHQVSNLRMRLDFTFDGVLISDASNAVTHPYISWPHSHSWLCGQQRKRSGPDVTEQFLQPHILRAVYGGLFLPRLFPCKKGEWISHSIKKKGKPETQGGMEYTSVPRYMCAHHKELAR